MSEHRFPATLGRTATRPACPRDRVTTSHLLDVGRPPAGDLLRSRALSTRLSILQPSPYKGRRPGRPKTLDVALASRIRQVEFTPGEPRRTNALLAAITLIELYSTDRRDDCNALVDPLDAQERDDLIAALISTGEFLTMMTGDAEVAVKALGEQYLKPSTPGPLDEEPELPRRTTRRAGPGGGAARTSARVHPVEQAALYGAWSVALT
jgi:hypothetical protein